MDTARPRTCLFGGVSPAPILCRLRRRPPHHGNAGCMDCVCMTWRCTQRCRRGAWASCTLRACSAPPRCAAGQSSGTT
eukprot:366217-Chlamydomonas_euryale.AAC.19